MLAWPVPRGMKCAFRAPGVQSEPDPLHLVVGKRILGE